MEWFQRFTRIVPKSLKFVHFYKDENGHKILEIVDLSCCVLVFLQTSVTEFIFIKVEEE